MTVDEQLKAMRKAYEQAEAIWTFDGYNNNVTAAAFYLDAVETAKQEITQSMYIKTKIVKFLEEKLDEALNRLSSKEVKDVFDLMERWKWQKREFQP